jgi:rSAM/selenodomain-associated transferase 2
MMKVAIPAQAISGGKSSATNFRKLLRARISAVVPVFNEAPLIESFLKHLRERARGVEIIVADGGSSDETAAIAAKWCDRVVITRRNRGAQMNAGARAARGAVLWFLHADAEVPANCVQQIERALKDKRVAGGYFRIRLPKRNVVYRLTDTFAHYAGLLLRMRCGDHGIFCRREIFDEISGFPEAPLMEDVSFFRALSRRGKISVVRDRLIASARRYEEVGPMRLTLAYGIIATLYAVGTPVSVLARVYRKWCCRSA